jgi:2-hydroxychromene-2-carboxylate isomerase
MNQMRLFYDLGCPWSYIALVRLQDVGERNRAELELCPVIVDQVLATENPALQASRWAENPAKAAWQRRDLDYWARFWGLDIALPKDWPTDVTRAAHAAAAAISMGRGLDYSLELGRRYFASGRGYDDGMLSEAAAAQGLDAAEFKQHLETPETAAAVQGWTEELVRLGGFGTPTVFIGDELFFGNDRIPLVDWLTGPVSGDSFVMPGQHG